MTVDGAQLLEESHRHLAGDAPALGGGGSGVPRRGAPVRRRGGPPRGEAGSRGGDGDDLARTLDFLVRAGLAREPVVSDGFKRYEPHAPGQAHEHCVCSSCSAMMEFTNDRRERMITLRAEEAEFRPQHHRLEVYGLCRNCQPANPLARTR